MSDFTQTSDCMRRVACGPCRISPEFRQAVGAPDVCPYGITQSTIPPPGHNPGGAGSHLKKLLSGWPFYIRSEPGCTCNEMAAKMDRMGHAWCESPEGMGEILDALRQNAEKRGLPFLDTVGRMIVRRALLNARNEETRLAKGSSLHPQR